MYVEIFDSVEEFKEFVESNDPWIEVISIIEVREQIVFSFKTDVKGMDRPERRGQYTK